MEIFIHRGSTFFFVSLLLSLSSLARGASQGGSPCKVMGFYPPLSGRRLEKHVDKSQSVVSEDFCQVLCFVNDNCRSVNFNHTADSTGQHACELNNSTATEHPVDLKKRVEFSYHETKDACASNPCEGNQICLPGVGPRGYECSCPPGYTGDACDEVLTESYFDQSDSEILKDHTDYMQKLLEYLAPVQVSGKRWRLCFRASENGYSAPAFHDACDNKGPTVTLVRVGDNVFGGYTDKSWDGNVRYIYSDNAFLFSLKNRDNKNHKMAIYQNKNEAMWSYSNDGPTFGGGYDLEISDKCNGNTGSKSTLGGSYQPPPGYTPYTPRANSLLAGSSEFKCDEYEVFYQQ